MIKRMSFKQFVFIIPLLCFMAVFSIYPVVTSIMYTFFDYRTNDQRYNSFYMSEKLNTTLFVEDCEYVNYFISADITLVEEEDQQAFAAIQERVTEMAAKYEGETETRDMTSAEREEVVAFIEEITAQSTMTNIRMFSSITKKTWLQSSQTWQAAWCRATLSEEPTTSSCLRMSGSGQP